MSEKKTTTTETYNVWKDKVPVFLPKATDGNQQFVYVCINDRTFQVPRGKRTLVAKPVYDVLMRSEYAQQITEAYDSAKRNVEK